MSWEVRVSRATFATDDESNGERWSTVPSIFGVEKKELGSEPECVARIQGSGWRMLWVSAKM